MKRELTVVIHVCIDGKDYLWDTLTTEKQNEIGTALNDRALRSIGYLPVEKTA